jgi:hypothetical protein
MPLDFLDVDSAEEDAFDFADDTFDFADDPIYPDANSSDLPHNHSDLPISSEPTQSQTDISTSEPFSDLSDLPRRSPVSWGHADQPGIGRGKGKKIRRYSSKMRSDDEDDDDEDDNELDDGDESEYLPS